MTNFENTVQALRDGEVIAYPTEGVFGVGCDPDNAEAIMKLLELKKRPVEKGLILIAANFDQLKPYVDESALSEEAKAAVFATWPGPVTWVMPAKPELSNLLSGQFDSIAVRVTDHPLVQKLCETFGKPLTSTSANLTGEPPCMTFQEVQVQLGDHLVAILEGETGGREKPSEIRDALTSQVLRQG
ncbi:threonylcarbamoyl-AMP synthase [Vibrio sp. SCSIO 43132]|uniref:L-threonylcarbamoyladenylate synthase n=1 Tax=Vibrio TaxID=662 RepID=UPI001CA9A918|nr:MULTISPECIES: L-threonylcarbamoyladenylate synthase [Vibrio]UAB70302.1 threonylcarbamoyl-AMP synthase [Vibrio sp. SCSIO 43132]BDU39019.1 threonylcarbamoyl-AMP synthase [Vibrio nigripulchritudo]BDU44739.1 threonylcarbamoyl-AMP synthase [Vibrio nigripulchritudo]